MKELGTYDAPLRPSAAASKKVDAELVLREKWDAMQKDVSESTVILYSGGMDSIVAAQLFPKAKLLYCNIGNRYGHKELLFLNQTAPRRVEVCNRLDLQGLDDVGGVCVLPNRNLLLVLMGAYYGSTIILNGTAGDVHMDKDQKFAQLATQLLRHMNRPMPHRDVTNMGKPSSTVQYSVLVPFAKRTKASMVRDFLKAGGDYRLLVDCISCHDIEYGQCGECLPCLRKYFALEANGIAIYTAWRTNPVFSCERVLKLIKAGTWTRKGVEDKDTLRVMVDLDVPGAAEELARRSFPWFSIPLGG